MRKEVYTKGYKKQSPLRGQKQNKDMTNLEKQQIATRLAEYCGFYQSQNKAANSLKNVSSATISQMLKGKKQNESFEEPIAWKLIRDEMWRNVAAQIGHSTDRWVVAKTRDFDTLTELLDYTKRRSRVTFIKGDTGCGKSETIDAFVESNKHAYVVKCNEFWNKKTFLMETLNSIGGSATGLNQYMLMSNIVKQLKEMPTPIIIFDEADKLSDPLLYFFITLYNNLFSYCAIVLIATEYLEKRIEKGIRLGKKGFPEIYSRGSRKFVALDGVCFSDVRAICVANGITKASTIKDIYDDSELDLRRVRDKIEAYIELRQPVETN